MQVSRRQFLKKAATIPGVMTWAAGPALPSGDHTPLAQGESQAMDEIFAAGEAMDSLVYSLTRYQKVRPAASFIAKSRTEA